MKWYPWLRPDFEELVASYQTGRSHHVLLIQALPGMGDDALIYALSRYLMCQQPEGHKSCGQYRDCQLIRAGTHLDYYSLLPKKGKSTSGVDAVREVSEKLCEHSRLGGAKVVWILDVAQLTDTATNALPKTLEEPPVQAWFFLASTEPARLPVTLRSRCRLHHLAPPPESYAISWLAREMTVPSEALPSTLRLSAGSLGAALTLLQAESWAHRTDSCTALVNTLNTGDWYILFVALNHDQVAARLHWLATLLTDALKRPYGISHLTNPDALDLISFIAERLFVAQVQAILGDACHCRQQLLSMTGVNRELVLTDPILRIEHYLQSGSVLPIPHL